MTYSAKPWNAEEAAAIIARFKGAKGGMLPVLHALDAAFGRIHDDAVPMLAESAGLEPSDIYGVISFYDSYHRKRTGTQVIKICRGATCSTMGSEQLIAHLTAKLGIGLGETTADGAFSLQEDRCMSNCDQSPSITAGTKLCSRMSPAKADALLDDLRQKTVTAQKAQAS